METMNAVEVIRRSCQYVQSGLTVTPEESLIPLCSRRYVAGIYEACRMCEVGEFIWSCYQIRPTPFNAQLKRHYGTLRNFTTHARQRWSYHASAPLVAEGEVKVRESFGILQDGGIME